MTNKFNFLPIGLAKMQVLAIIKLIRQLVNAKIYYCSERNFHNPFERQFVSIY